MVSKLDGDGQKLFERFVEKSPISVMVRAALERVLGADRLDQWYLV